MSTMMEIDVTAEDINKGVIHPCKCPIALALMRVLGKPVAMDTLTITFFPKKNPYWEGKFSIPTPQPAIDFMSKFDRKQPVAPFTFNLKVPLEEL